MKLTKSGPCYSNVSLIKKALFQSQNGKLPLYEIVLYVKLHWHTFSEQAFTIEKMVELALFAPKSYFQEDNNGLWEVKNQIDTSLDFVLTYMKNINRPIEMKELHRKLKVTYGMNEFEQLLLNDVRFTQIQSTNYWMLSESELSNDLVYEYMQIKKISSALKEEIEKEVIDTYQLDNSTVNFAPELDTRFRIFKKYIEIDLDENIYEQSKVEVPIEVNEEVARKSLKIIGLIYSCRGICDTKEIVTEVFRVKAHDPKFGVYYQAVELFLHTTENLVRMSNGKWKLNQEISIDLSTTPIESWKYAVYGSVPVIKNTTLLEDSRSEERSDLNQNTVPNIDNKKKQNGTSLTSYHIVSYYERVKGYFPVPKILNEWFKKFEQLHGFIHAEIEGFRYDWCWKVQDDVYYFYGDGVFDFFADYLVEVGQRLRLELLNSELIKIDLLNFDDRYAAEQTRYLDIGRLVEESTSVNKSIFTIMCETLAAYPSGVHWTTLLDKVNEIRSTTRNTIYNLLSKNSCFESIESKKGYWRLVISKLSRYYVDEDGQEVEKTFSEEEEQGSQATLGELQNDRSEQKDTVSLGHTKQTALTVQRNQAIQGYKDPYDHDVEYELPPLWETFSKWAEKQKNVRFQKAKQSVKGKAELVEIITKSYAKILTRLSKTRTTYAISEMDLVQEGYLGLLHAMETYEHKYGRSFVNYAIRGIILRFFRYKIANNGLVKVSASILRSIYRYEKLMTETLLLHGRVPADFELEKLGFEHTFLRSVSQVRNTDYISFGELWEKTQFDKKSRNIEEYAFNTLMFSYPWFGFDVINQDISNIYYDKPNAELLEELNYLCDIPESNTEYCWDNCLEESVFGKELIAGTDKLLRMLPDIEQYVIRFRYGIGCEQKTQAEIAEELNLSQSYISRIEVKVLNKLKGAALGLELDSFVY
ncbi:sigma-70 family RNA polymerase sigma factor [Brevibacillus nitrificans]|uniref:sigma-70 family RNA polymerase sigma factor n=1 Tax=Brevibacillus nitrificans TaxID=651560 RepID=UPI002864FF82|nr:sigma-70 family RNA polymerase sigma factor [Brevibacillus nitrificans]MDR7316062.1 RNA polymerase sigma factor (sigma-70 family) [Brevibacillus nitrificans]